MSREEMPFHPAASLFPLDQESIGSLADDIRSNGQQVPIELLDGAVIDGRRRWLACSIAQIEPITRSVSPVDPIAYVLSLNIHRRHLSPTQLSMVGARAREMYDKQAKERQRDHGRTAPGKQKENTGGKFTTSDKARDAAGKAVGVSGKSIDYATRVIRGGVDELVKAADEDKIAISTAARIASLPQEKQVEAVENAIKNPRKRRETYEQEDLPEGESRGVGVQRANEAINCLSRIPKNDRLRKRGFQIVTDWIRHNK